MKRCCGQLLVVCMMLTSLARAADLVRDGKPVAKILVSEALVEAKEPEPRAKTRPDPGKLALSLAVADLNYHLGKMSDATLPVEVVQASNGAGPAIVLGKLAVDAGAKPSKSTPSKEAFRLIVKDDRILIGGESDAAVALGVYELLRQLGCDWVMPGELGEVIPRKSSVSIAAVDLDKAPDFYLRRLWFRGGAKLNTPEDFSELSTWLRRLQSGQWDHAAFDTAGHAWDAFIKKHKEEFDKDPTMLALRRAPDGTLQRMGPQIETTHPRVIELFVQDIKKKYEQMIASGAWTKDTAAGFPIGPADGLGYSESTEAAIAGAGRIDPIVGEPDQTDLLILLGNKILEAVHKEYPNAYVGYYSYSTHADYPARYKPNPKIVQIFAPINFSRFHSVVDPISKTQAYYCDVVEQWAKLSKEQGNPLVYRGYNWNLAENGLPYSKARIWGEELPFYKANGIMGLNVEATKAWAVNGPSDYVFMRLAFDTSLDWKQLLHEYCQKAFGTAAGPAMEQYLLAIADRQRDAGQEAGSYHAYPLMYDKAWVQEQRSRIEQALAAAQTPSQKTLVASQLNVLKGLDLFLDFVAASNRLDFSAVQATFKAMHDNWQALYDMDSQLAAKEVPQYFKRYLELFVTEGSKYSQSPYTIVHAIPEELPTLWDPEGVGHLMRFYEPQISDARFVPTHTFSSTWDAQGLGSMRDAAVWYRVRFTLPKEAAGQPIGLFIGAVEDEARVWINGQSIGTSGRGFSKPFLFDLTDGIKHDGENVLAIQVVRNSMANEIGLGGIFRPCYVFAGPRLEAKSPKPLELRRILPGGELGEIEN